MEKSAPVLLLAVVVLTVVVILFEVKRFAVWCWRALASRGAKDHPTPADERRGGAKPRGGLPPSTDFIGAIPRGDGVTRYSCGHEGPTVWEFNAWGETIAVMDASYNMPPACPDCMIGKDRPHLIRCCLCGYAIGPGDSVALYPRTEGVRTEATVVATSRGEKVVGCLRWDCCQGAFYAGSWSREGFKPAFPENRTALDEAAASPGKPAVVEDL